MITGKGNDILMAARAVVVWAGGGGLPGGEAIRKWESGGGDEPAGEAPRPSPESPVPKDTLLAHPRRRGSHGNAKESGRLCLCFFPSCPSTLSWAEYRLRDQRWAEMFMMMEAEYAPRPRRSGRTETPAFLLRWAAWGTDSRL